MQRAPIRVQGGRQNRAEHGPRAARASLCVWVNPRRMHPLLCGAALCLLARAARKALLFAAGQNKVVPRSIALSPLGTQPTGGGVYT